MFHYGISEQTVHFCKESRLLLQVHAFLSTLKWTKKVNRKKSVIFNLKIVASTCVESYMTETDLQEKIITKKQSTDL